MRNNQSLFNMHQGNMIRGMSDKSTIPTEYIYKYTTDDLVRTLNNVHRDLDYPLRVEPKRDRIVYNASGLKKELYRIASEVIDELSLDLSNEISQDVYNSVGSALNSLCDGKPFVPINCSNNHKSHKSDLATMLGKALVDNAKKLYDELKKYD